MSAAVAEIPSPLDAETGIVRWVVDIADDPGEPAIFNCSAKMAETRTFMPLGCFDANGGAGLSREAARGAALGEALERYCSSAYFADELRLGSYREIAGTTRSLSPQELRLFHPHQRRAIKYSVFDEDTLITWTQAFSLTRREPLLVPASIVYVPYYPFYLAQGEQTIGPSISTGQACASDPVSATLRGLYEVIERDAFTIGWLHRLPGRRINLDSVPRMKLLFEQRFARAHLEYTLLQLATDIEITSVLCVVIDDSFDPPLIATGGAASLDAEEAVRKALVEAAQTRQWAKFLGSQPRPIVIEPDWSNIHDFERHVFLYAYGDMLDAVDFLRTASEEVDLAELPHSRASGPGALDDARERVEAAGCEVLVVDLTTIDVAASGYSVMKVLVPTAQQLEGDHTHRLLGSPRLFSVPAKLGLEARTYATLNPDPHPYP